jgi:hypothetical protein
VLLFAHCDSEPTAGNRARWSSITGGSSALTRTPASTAKPHSTGSVS